MLAVVWRRRIRALATGPSTCLFDYSVWVRYGGWMIYSGIFLVVFPIVKWNSPAHPSVADLARDLLGRPLVEWTVFGPLLMMMATLWIFVPMLGLVAFLSAPAIALCSDGLRLVPMPPLRIRDVKWSEITRFVQWPVRRTGRPANYTVSLSDESYFTIFSTPLKGVRALVEAIGSHVQLEESATKPSSRHRP
jgi:hypothetical protein